MTRTTPHGASPSDAASSASNAPSTSPSVSPEATDERAEELDVKLVSRLVGDVRDLSERGVIDFDFANDLLLWCEWVTAYGAAPTRRGLGTEDPRLSEYLHRWGYRMRKKHANPAYDSSCDSSNPAVIEFYQAINSPDCDLDDATIEAALVDIDHRGTPHDDSTEAHLLSRLPLWEWVPGRGTPFDDDGWNDRFSEAVEVSTRLGRLPTASESRRVYDWLRGQSSRSHTPEQQALLLTLPGWAERIGRPTT